MKRTRILALLLIGLSLVGCQKKEEIDWKSYSEDYNNLITISKFSTTYPFTITGRSTGYLQNYRMGLTIDNASTVLTDVKILVMPFANDVSFDEDSRTPIIPFLGYDFSNITLSTLKDEENDIYEGLNIGFTSLVANPRVKISFKSEQSTYYIDFQNFIFEEVQS